MAAYTRQLHAPKSNHTSKHDKGMLTKDVGHKSTGKKLRARRRSKSRSGRWGLAESTPIYTINHQVVVCVTATLLMILGSDAFTTLKVEKTLQFTYSGATGPGRWASLNPNFSLCATGKSQSPINIVADQAVVNNKLKPLIRDYRAVNVTLVDNKFTVAIEYPDHTGGINVDDKPYTLKQMHWHSPSEHRINGNRFAAELHMVHVSDDGKVVVVATLFQQGHPDPVLGKIHKKLNELANEFKSNELATTPIEVGVFHPRELRETPTKYYRYVGSFSAPPCTQNVIYLILAKARSISREQVEALKAPLDFRCKNNARPCQPINGRHVEVYQDSVAHRNHGRSD